MNRILLLRYFLLLCFAINKQYGLICRTQNAAALRNEDDGRIGNKTKLNYDYFNRPIVDGLTDGNWEPSVPVDPATGLFYDPAVNSSPSEGNGSSHNGNNHNKNHKSIPDWYDLLHQFVQHGYDTGLRGSSPQDHPLLLCERAYNPPSTRQWTLECLFEELQVPATFLSKEAVLACYACGRTSATVIDVGYSGTTVAPVCDGYVEGHAVQRNPGASLKCVDETILQNLDALYYRRKKQKNSAQVPVLYQARSGHPTKRRKETIHRAARLQLARECRESGAGASINTALTATSSGGAAATFHAPSQSFELPDGTVLDVPSQDRFRAAGLLFGSDTASQQAREATLHQTKTVIAQYIANGTSSAADSSSNNNNNRNNGKDSSGITPEQWAREAVGLAGRTLTSSKRGRGVPSSKRSTATWQRACTAHLQTMLEQQQLFTAAPLAQMVCDAAYRCERDQQVPLLGNVIVSGGGACLGPTEQAVPDAVKESLEAIIHLHTPAWRVKVLTPAVSERPFLPWMGGSILASLGSFHEMWITKAEYEEWGSAIVNRKCP